MKTVLQTTSASLIFSPGAPGLGFLDFSRIYDTVPFSINRLMVVVNQTRNQVIYAETQQGFGYTSWNIPLKRLFLACDTSSHSPGDYLQVIYDAPDLKISPAEEYYDPVNKLRTSQPQALIDTDFEYGVQPTKWEFLFTENNRPFAFYDPSTPLPITDITVAGGGSRTTTVTLGVNHNLRPTTPIFIQETTNSDCNGWFIVDTGFTGTPTTTFTYTANAADGGTSRSIFDSSRTFAFSGAFYQSSGIPVAANAFSGTSTITCTTTGSHGLARGSQVFIMNTTSSPSINGAHMVTAVPTSNSFTFVPAAAPAAAPTNAAGPQVLFPRGDGFVLHRPFDGGVMISTGTRAGSGSPYSTVIRQTRKYFRYQSGKGIQFSTGSVFRPALNVNRVIAGGTGPGATVTVSTKGPHGLCVGSAISVSGSTDSAFNGFFTVQTVPNDINFTYTTVTGPTNAGDAPANNPVTIFPEPQYGCAVRLGLFDQQNGMFFENDGVNNFIVRRNSTLQLTGTVSVALGSNVVTGLGTLFSSQLNPGDFVVIRGMSYRVLSIASNTSMFISPEWRGATGIDNAVISKTVDTKIPQQEWNIDTMDGKGPSNYNFDPKRMQMFYIDYSWYGAGFIRYGMRAQNGNVYYCHKMVNNNVNTEAYLRSGNLPARYEETNFASITRLAAGGVTGSSPNCTISVDSTKYWPSSGIIKVNAPGQSGAVEYMLYRRATATTFEDVIRPITGGANTPQTFTYSNDAPVSIELVGLPGSGGFSQANPISHWGSSVIMDGRYDDDTSFVFNIGSNQQSFSGPNQRQIVAMLRLAPSVDSGRIGAFGAREVVNRMQLKLRGMDALVQNSAAGFRIEVILNGRIVSSTPPSWINVGGSSLVQYAYPTGAVGVTGGELVFGFFAPGGGTGTSVAAGFTQQDLSGVRELSNSILGGGTISTVAQTGGYPQQFGVYPDGPDVLYIVATSVGSGLSQTLNSRISWTEAQA